MAERIFSIYKGRYVAPIFKTFGRSFYLPPLVFLVLYWLLPLIALAVQGFMEGGDLGLKVLHMYIYDEVHLAFAINSAVIIYFAYRFVRLLEFRMRDIIRNSPGSRVPNEVIGSFKSFSQFPFGMISITAASSLSAACLFLLVHRTLAPEYSDWWGSSAFGYAGIIYSAVASTFVFLFVKYCSLLGAVSAFLVWFTAANLRLRPLNADGTSGLGRFASMMISIWAQTILLSLTLLIIVQTNYLGLADSFAVWLLAGIIVLVAPFAAILPFATVVSRARRLKKELIIRLLRDRFAGNLTNTQVSTKEVLEFLETKKSLQELDVFPFLSFKFFAVVGFNLVQLYLAVAAIVTGAGELN